MAILPKRAYSKNEAITWPIPNYWDLLAMCIIFGIIIFLVWGAAQMTRPYDLGQPLPISLDPSHLPFYALRTTLRMFIALFFSLLFTFVFGTWAAKSKRAERIIIPLIDIMQSAPVLSFLAITAPIFILLFRGSLLGPECAAIFAIFTAQVWNMALSFYQSVSTVPKDLREVSKIFQLSAWQSFWRMEVPFAMPGLLWNMMMSMSGSWFFVTASEAISVANQKITLPGIGSYIAMAIVHANKMAIVYAIAAMLIIIFLYDQLLFRPLVVWSEKFKSEEVLDEKPSHSWIADLFHRALFLRQIGAIITTIFNGFVNLPWLNKKPIYRMPSKFDLIKERSLIILANIIIWAAILTTVFIVGHFLYIRISWKDIEQTLWLGLITGIRVMVLITLCSLIWIPVGVWIGFRPRVAEKVQPILQFLAAFPANLLFPIATYLIIKYALNTNIWVSPLMVLGTQWYILFNVIAGASTIPEDLRQTARSFGVKGWLCWKRLYLPGIFPYFVTGAITAAGGAWNASIVAEAVGWGVTKLKIIGLGGYIAHSSDIGNFSHIALGTIIMCLFVLIINRLLWRPLYNIAIEKFRAE